ncbi:hypothetical protein [Lysobacter sp. HA35]
MSFNALQMFRSVPAEFSSPLGAEEAAAALAAATRRWFQFGSQDAYAKGKVSALGVTICCAGPSSAKPFKKYFVGTFAHQGEGSLLSGNFTIHPFAKIVAALWLGFIVLWTVFAGIIAIKQPQVWWFPLAGAGIFAIGLLLFASGNRAGYRDAQWIVSHISRAIAGRPNNSSKPTPLRGAA